MPYNYLGDGHDNGGNCFEAAKPGVVNYALPGRVANYDSGQDKYTVCASNNDIVTWNANNGEPVSFSVDFSDRTIYDYSIHQGKRVAIQGYPPRFYALHEKKFQT